jgi:hypothetical protein
MTNLHGIVQGNSIVLREALGLPNGQEVTVNVVAAAAPTVEKSGEGLLRSFGAWADEGPEFDEYLRTCRQELPNERPELEP